MLADEENPDISELLRIKKDVKEQVQKWFVQGEVFDTYVIPANTELFKSFRKPLNEWKYEPISGPAFFGFHEMISRQYGFAFSYTTNREYKLLAMDSKKTLEYLHNTLANGIEDIQEAIKKSYGFPYGEGKPQIRDSVGSTDWKVVQFLCSKIKDTTLQGVEGYAANFIQEPIPGSQFPPECVICETPDVRLNTRYSENGINGLATPSKFLDKVGLKFEPKPPTIGKRKERPDEYRIDYDGVPKFSLGGSRKRRQRKTRRNLKKKRRTRQTRK